MSRNPERKYRVVTSFQRWIGNPLLKRLPIQTLLETTGRKSGLPRAGPGRRTAGGAGVLVRQRVRRAFADRARRPGGSAGPGPRPGPLVHRDRPCDARGRRPRD